MTFEEVLAVYNGSDGEATKALYARLIATDMARGQIAVNLLRTCKASERAKKYRGKPGRGGPSYRAMAYEKKDWSINELCRALVQSEVIESWGWGFDAKAIGFEHGWQTITPGSPYGAPSVPANTSRYIILLSDGQNTMDRWYGNGSVERSTPDASDSGGSFGANDASFRSS